MKILYIIGGAKKAYGSERVAMDILKGITCDRESDAEFVVVTANYGPINEFCKKYQIENYSVPFDFYVYKKNNNYFFDYSKRMLRLTLAVAKDYFAIKKIENIIDMNSIDVIHSNLSRTMLGARLAQKYNIPHIWHLQELLTGHYGLDLLMKNQIEWMNSHCNRFIAVSDAVKKSWIKGGLNKKKIIRIYNGVNVIDVNERIKIDNDKRIEIVMVGELSEAKGQHVLLEALARLQNNARYFRVNFIGDGKNAYIEKIKRLIEKYKLDVVFYGFIKHEDLNLARYDIGVVCSKGEGFGLSTLEYMSAGLCVLATDSGANNELISNEKTGFLFNRSNIDEFSKKLSFLFYKPHIIRKYGYAAREYVIKKFDLRKQLLAIESVYNQECR